MAHGIFSGHGSWMSYYRNRWDRFLIAKRARVKPVKRKTATMTSANIVGEDDEESDDDDASKNAAEE